MFALSLFKEDNINEFIYCLKDIGQPDNGEQLAALLTEYKLLIK